MNYLLYKSINTSNASVVSFDVFDTLITRCARTPVDIFSFVESLVISRGDLIDGFKDRRIKAEKDARSHSPRDEITLEAIYQEMRGSISDQVLEHCKTAEIETELNFCLPIDDNVAAYRQCLLDGKTVALVSDMYLPETAVAAMLEKCGISGFDKLFLSSSYLETKASGKLFDIVLSHYNINAPELFHCGDSERSDLAVPRARGVNAYLVAPSKLHEYRNANNKHFSHAYRITDLGKMADYCTEDEVSRYGFIYFGPLLFEFSRWLHARSEMLSLSKLFFLSRDGYILMEAYKKLYPNNACDYLYSSRRSFEVPTLCLEDSLKDMLTCIRLTDTISVEKLLRRFGLDCAELADEMQSAGLDCNSVIRRDCILNDNRISNLYSGIKSRIISNSRLELRALEEYLRLKIQTSERIGIVDIGWHGSMQLALSRILKHMNLNTNLFGFYTGLYMHQTWENELNMESFLFSKNENSKYARRQTIYNALYELMFTAPHGSVEKFELDDHGKPVPIFLPYELPDIDANSFAKFQLGALRFVEEAMERNFSEYFVWSNKDILERLECLGLNPTKDEAEIFGDYTSYDFGNATLAKPECSWMRQPKKFLSDLSNSLWKPGYLRRAINLPVNYGKVIYCIGLATGRYQ